MPRTTSKPTKLKLPDNVDLLFTFKYVCIACHVHDSIPEEEQEEIKNAVKYLSREIWIDKSYVEFKENKHKDTFMLEDGWNELCALVILTKCGKNATKLQNAMMQESFNLMILCYAYLFLENLGYNTDDIVLEMVPNGRYMVEYEEDTILEWKRYPGKWLTWDLNNNLD